LATPQGWNSLFGFFFVYKLGSSRFVLGDWAALIGHGHGWLWARRHYKIALKVTVYQHFVTGAAKYSCSYSWRRLPSKNGMHCTFCVAMKFF